MTGIRISTTARKTSHTLNVPDEEKPEILGKEWDGSASEFKRVLLLATPDIRDAQDDLAASHSDLYDLLMALNSKDGEDPTLLGNPTTLLRAQRYLDPSLTKDSTMTTPQIQKKIQKNRMHIWKCVFADVCSVIGKSVSHKRGGLKLLARTANAAAFQLFDPNFGIWESLVEKRFDHNEPSEETIRRAYQSSSFNWSVFAKRSGACYIRNQVKRLERQVGIVSASFPLTEYEQETQFQTNVLLKKWAAADATNFSKELDRQRRAERHTRYFPAPQIGRPDRTNSVSASVLTSPRMHSKISNHSINSASLTAMMNDTQTQQVVAVDNEDKFFTKRLQDLKNELTETISGKGSEEWPAELKEVVAGVCDKNVVTSGPTTLGLRGIEFRTLLKRGCHPLKNKFHRTCGRWWMEKKNIAARIKEQGGVVMRNGNTAAWIPMAGNAFIFHLKMSKNMNDDNKLHWRKADDFANFDADYFDEWDLYDGPLIIKEDQYGGVWLEIDPAKWLLAKDMQIEYFPHADPEVQVHMLEEFCEMHPRMKSYMVKRMSSFTRGRLFTEFMLGNRLSENVLERIEQKFGNKEEVLGLDGEEWDEKMHKEKIAKLAKKAGKESGPQQQKEREEKAVHTPGKTRKSPLIRLTIYDMSRGRPHLRATARSHRVEQGAKPDVLRLYWENDHKPSLVHQFPECPVGSDPVANAQQVFGPRLAKEFGVRAHHIIAFKDEFYDEATDFIDGYVESAKSSPPAKRQKKGGKT
eukprot:g2354.t1